MWKNPAEVVSLSHSRFCVRREESPGRCQEHSSFSYFAYAAGEPKSQQLESLPVAAARSPTMVVVDSSHSRSWAREPTADRIIRRPDLKDPPPHQPSSSPSLRLTTLDPTHPPATMSDSSVAVAVSSIPLDSDDTDDEMMGLRISPLGGTLPGTTTPSRGRGLFWWTDSFDGSEGVPAMITISRSTLTPSPSMEDDWDDDWDDHLSTLLQVHGHEDDNEDDDESGLAEADPDLLMRPVATRALVAEDDDDDDDVEENEHMTWWLDVMKAFLEQKRAAGSGDTDEESSEKESEEEQWLACRGNRVSPAQRLAVGGP